MRLNTMNKYLLTCDVYEPTGPDSERVYGDSRQVRVSLMNEGGAGMALGCDEPLPRFTRIQNLRDAGGTEVFPDRADRPTTYEVMQAISAVDAFGFNDGYRLTIRRISL